MRINDRPSWRPTIYEVHHFGTTHHETHVIQQMDSLRQTQDPQQRQKLLDEHWATMQSAMSLMHGMWGPGMMGGPGMRGGRGIMGGAGMMGGPGMMGWGGMRGYYSKLTPEQEKQRQYMMDQMLQRQQGLTQPPAPPAAK